MHDRYQHRLPKYLQSLVMQISTESSRISTESPRISTESHHESSQCALVRYLAFQPYEIYHKLPVFHMNLSKFTEAVNERESQYVTGFFIYFGDIINFLL